MAYLHVVEYNDSVLEDIGITGRLGFDIENLDEQPTPTPTPAPPPP